MEKQRIEAENNIMLTVFGSFDENIKYIEKLYGVKIVNRDGSVTAQKPKSSSNFLYTRPKRETRSTAV